MLSVDSSPPLALKLNLKHHLTSPSPTGKQQHGSVGDFSQHFSETISSENLSCLLEEKHTSLELVVIDLRGRPYHMRGHIKGAILCSYDSSRLSMSKNLFFAKSALVEKVNSSLRQDVVVYMNSSLDNKRHFEAIEFVVSHLKRPKSRIRLLEGGYEEFSKQFGHLCENDQTQLSASVNQRQNVSKIFPFLYLGDEVDSSDEAVLFSRGIDHVINATAELDQKSSSDNKHYIRLPLIDSAGENLCQYFAKAFIFIETARRRGSCVLVHCQAGISRSAAIVIAYIMAHSQLGLHESFQTVRRSRPMISPNFGFLGQLIEFEENLKKGLYPRNSILHDACYLPRT